MAFQEPPEMLVQKFEELKEWQRQQQEKLLREQEAQRALLSSEQRKLYQEYGLDKEPFGYVDMQMKDYGSTRPAYVSNFVQEPSQYLPPERTSSYDGQYRMTSPLSNEMRLKNSEHIPSCDDLNTGALTKHTVFFDDIPVPSPKKDFNQLLKEKLESKNDENVNKKGKTSAVIKRPYLKRGEGLARYGLNANKKKIPKKSVPLSKPKSVPSIPEKSKAKPTCSSDTRPASNIKNHASSTECPRIIAPNTALEVKTHIEPETRQPFVASNESSGLAHNPTWSHVLMNKSEGPTNNNAHKASLATIDLHQSTWSSSFSPRAEKVKKKEQDELRVFELLEQKAANSSFCSTASTIARLLERSPLSTPNKQNFTNVQTSDSEGSPQQHELERSLHIRFTENRFKTFKDSRGFDSTLYEDSMESTEDSVSYVFNDTNVRTVNVASTVTETNQSDGQVRSENAFQSLKYVETDFQDNVAWSDDCSCSSISEERSDSKCSSSSDDESHRSHSGTLKKQHSEDCVIDLTITELKESKFTSPLPETPNAGLEKAADGEIFYKSDLLRKRLEELESEIETFRKENANLLRLKRSNELQEAKLNKERKEFEKSYKEKEESLMGLLDSERKKLANEKKVFERYCKDLKNQPSKGEREEIVALKLQVENLREELVKKDSRWSATQVRTRDRVKLLESENSELKAQVHKLKREKQEALKLAAPKPSKVTDTKVIHAINNHIGRIKPSELKNSIAVKNAAPKKPIPRSVLTRPSPPVERPIWGARNLKFRRTKSVPDVRTHTPPPIKIIIKKTRNLNRRDVDESSDNVEDNSESDSDSEPEQPVIDANAAQRYEKLQQTIYDTFYNNLPGLERNLYNSERPGAQNSRLSDENAKDTNVTNKKRVEFNTVPEILTGSSRMTNLREEKVLQDRSGLGTTIDSRETNHRFSNNHSAPDTVSYEQQHSLSNSDASIQSNTTHNSPNTRQETVTNMSDGCTVIEIEKPNGNREKSFSDGRREIWYRNGNVKKISADKSISKMIYFNGDVKETLANDSTTKYYYAETKTWHSTYADGLEILEFSNGQVERRTNDGLTEISFPNGCLRRCHPDGRDEWAFSDGTRVETTLAGDKVVQMPNGQREIHTTTHKRREYPDGTVKLVYPDGLQETRYSNGRIRLKDKDGNLIMDTNDAA